MHLTDHRRIEAQFSHADDISTVRVLRNALRDLAAYASELTRTSRCAAGGARGGSVRVECGDVLMFPVTDDST